MLDADPQTDKEKLRIVIPTDRGERASWQGLPAQRNYLILGIKTDRDWYQIDPPRNALNPGFLDAKADDDCLALVVLPTKHDKLPDGFSGAELKVAALLDCLDDGDDSKFRVVVDILATAPPANAMRPDARDPEFLERWNETTKKFELYPNPNRRMTHYCPDGPLPKHLRDKAKNKTQYQKSKVNELLLRWRVPGSLKEYVLSLEPLLKVPGAYADEEMIEYGSGLIPNPNYYADLDGGFIYEANEYLDKITTASNTKLLPYWIEQGWSHVFSGEHFYKMAILLDYPNVEVVFRVMARLSRLIGDPNGMPRKAIVVDGEVIPYPDFEEKRAYWKRKFDIR